MKNLLNKIKYNRSPEAYIENLFSNCTIFDYYGKTYYIKNDIVLYSIQNDQSITDKYVSLAIYHPNVVNGLRDKFIELDLDDIEALLFNYFKLCYNIEDEDCCYVSNSFYKYEWIQVVGNYKMTIKN